MLIGIGITILRDAQVVTIVLRTLVKEIEGQSVRRPIVSRPSRHLALFRDHMGSEHAPYPKQRASNMPTIGRRKIDEDTEVTTP